MSGETRARVPVPQEGHVHPAAGGARAEGQPVLVAPTMLTLMIAGLAWVVTTYIMRGDYPVPGIGNWNLTIGFA